MKNTKKMVALLLALTLMLGCVIGGTVAYLIDQTSTIENTFTSSDVSIKLEEDNPTSKTDIKMVPGAEITKDPKVTVLKNSEDCYLFIKVVPNDAVATYLEYEVSDGWTKLDGVDHVYYRTVSASDKDQEFGILVGDKVTVKNTVTKSQMTENFTAPTLSFTAYAIQKNHLKDVSDAAGAWTLINTSAQG